MDDKQTYESIKEEAKTKKLEKEKQEEQELIYETTCYAVNKKHNYVIVYSTQFSGNVSETCANKEAFKKKLSEIKKIPDAYLVFAEKIDLKLVKKCIAYIKIKKDKLENKLKAQLNLVNTTLVNLNNKAAELTPAN